MATQFIPPHRNRVKSKTKHDHAAIFAMIKEAEKLPRLSDEQVKAILDEIAQRNNRVA